MSAYEDPGLVGFFTENRNRPEDLYPSERRFLPWLAEDAASVLDVGCAAGGFHDIWRAFNPRIDYAGVDVSEALVEVARARHPDSRFIVGDCASGLQLPDGVAEIVQALGWLHWEPRYSGALAELWRLTGRALFFDVRLVPADGADVVGSQAIGEGVSTPYVVVPWERMARALRGLGRARILAFGYEGSPASTVSGAPATVCFAAFVLERGGTDVCIDLPLPWPEAFEGLERLPPERLTELVLPA